MDMKNLSRVELLTESAILAVDALYELPNLEVFFFTSKRENLTLKNTFLKNLNFVELYINCKCKIGEEAFSNNGKLRILNLTNVITTGINKNFFSGLSVLTDLIMKSTETQTLPHDLLYELIEIEKIDFSNNKIEFLHASTFFESLKLKTLILFNNQIKTIEPNTFINNKRLEIMSLALNQISSVDKECFTGLEGLKNLDLSSNPIKTIHSKTFEYLPSLQVLCVSDTKLSEQDAETFSTNLKLEVL